jgi:hypothetical protein
MPAYAFMFASLLNLALFLRCLLLISVIYPYKNCKYADRSVDFMTARLRSLYRAAFTPKK